jgi:hypothetical protein
VRPSISTAVYGSACKRQFVAVHTVVCAQCAQQCVAVCLIVYGSAHSSVRVFGSAAVCGSMRQCGSVQQSVRGLRAVEVCGSAHGSERIVCAAVCGSALGSVWQCALRGSVRVYFVRLCGSVR